MLRLTGAGRLATLDRLTQGGSRMRLPRRGSLLTTGATSVVLAAARPAPRVHAAIARTITVTHSVSTFVYGQHLVAKEKKFFEDEGVSVPSFIVPGGGAKVAQALAAGQAMFALGDSNHPLKITEKGRDALMIFATDTRCSYANIVVRQDLFDKDVRSVEALADPRRVGRKAVVAATAIGSGTHVYGVYVLKQTKAADGTPVNDHVDWVGGGASTTMLGGLKAGKFDSIMAGAPVGPAPGGEGLRRASFTTPGPYARAVDMGFVRKAQATYKS